MQTTYQIMSDHVPIAVHSWSTKKKPEAVIHIVHGMAEHALRYDSFAQEAILNNFTVIASDNRGHGKTIGTKCPKGYLADKDGFNRVTNDQKEINNEIQKLYPNIPIVMLGHSFGSFITQNYIENYGNSIHCAILSGSAGPKNVQLKIASFIANLNCAITGDKHISNFMNFLSFSSFNKKIKNAKTPFDWLSRDEYWVEEDIEDELCGFVCTSAFYKDLLIGLKQIHKINEIKKIPNSLPILIISGKCDPVSDGGKSVKKLYEIYKANGINNAQLKIYENARHEILNEVNKEEVKKDIFSWIKSSLNIKI